MGRLGSLTVVGVSWVASAFTLVLAATETLSSPVLWPYVVTAIIVAVTAVLTWATNRNNRWKDNFESEVAAHRLTREQCDSFRLEAQQQRELKHQLRNELAAEKLKHDFTPVLKAIQEFQQDHGQLREALEGRTELFTRLVEGQQALHEGQQELVRAVEALVDKLNDGRSQ